MNDLLDIKERERKTLKENLEKKLVRSGNLLNSLGILRSVKINGNALKKERFIELVKQNWMITDKIPLEISNRIEKVWQESIELFKEMKIDNNSTNQEIKIKEYKIF